MDRKKGLFIILLVIVVVVFFKFRSLGLSVVQTESSVDVLLGNYPPVIGFINSTIYVCERDRLFYLFNATDSDGDSLTGSIYPQNPFFLFWFSQTPPNTHTFAIVSGTLDKDDVGGVNSGNKTYAENITISDDSDTDSELTNITIIEINNIPSVEDIGVKTVWTQGVNSTFYEVFDVTDTEKTLGYGSFNFSVNITNSTSGEQVNLFNISSTGVMEYTGNRSDVGVYNVSVCVSDIGLSNPHPLIYDECNQTGGANTVCDNFSLTVTDENRAPNITDYYPSDSNVSISGTTTAYFNITKSDPDGTIPDTYWYVDGVLQEVDSGASVDEFFYSFGCGTSDNKTVFVNITDGELNDSMEWNLTYVASGCPVEGGGGGGGGGGGAAVSNFELDPQFITATVFQQEGKSFEVSVKNLGSSTLNLNLGIENITDLAILSDENLEVGAGETKSFKVYLYALGGTDPGVYYGKILVSSGSLTKAVSVVVEVKAKEALFDVKVIVPPEYKLVNPGDKLPVDVNLLNVGLYGTPVDVELYLYITDFDKILIYETQKELIAVESNLTVRRDLFVPYNVVRGTYLVLGEVTYGNLTVSTYDTFNVAEKKYLRATFFIIILAIIVLISLILFILWRRRKKKEGGNR